MPEYFVRLSTLLGTTFPEKLPVLGYLARHVGVRQWRESWNSEASVVQAEAVLEGEAFFELGGFRFSFGDPSEGLTPFRLEIASDRNSLLTSLADRGEEMAGITNPPPSDGLQVFARADGPPSASRIQLHDLAFRVRFPRSWAQKGVVQGDRLVPDGDQPVDVVFPRATIVFDLDAEMPVQVLLDDDELVSVDPIYLPNLGIGIEIQKLKLDFSRETGIPEVLARPGYQETWRGLYLEKFRIYGMDTLLPTLPRKVDPEEPADLIVELSKVVIGFDDGGVTGTLKAEMQSPDDDRVLRGGGFVIELERGNLIRCEHSLTLRVGKTGGPEFSVGPEGDLRIVAVARFSPDGRLGFELALQTPGTADRGLVSLGPDAALMIQAAIATWLVIDDLRDAEYTDALLLSGLLTVLSALQLNDMLGFERITLDALRLRYREELVAGRSLRWLDVILELELRISLDLPLKELLPWAAHFLPDIQTDPEHPLGVLMKGLRVSYAVNYDDFTEAELGGRTRRGFAWPDDYLFDLSDQSLFSGSPVILAKFGFGRWDRGVWIDLGLKLAVNEPAAAYSLMPSVVRLYLLATGEIDHATFEGLSLSILVPGVLFVRGRLNLGDTVTEASLQGYFISRPGLSREEMVKPEHWHWDVGAQYRKAVLEDGTESSIVFAWLRSKAGIPVFFLPGTALYGGHFLYADNARPSLAGQSIERWYAEREPKNQIVIDKWEGAAGSTGVGFGLVLGAQADRGRPWNLQLGLLYADSQWLLTGYLNLFKANPDPAETRAGSLRFIGAWGPGRLLGSVRWTELVPADGKVMKLDLGAELLVEDAADRSHFYAGYHWPPERHLKAVLFERYEASFYLMQDAADVENFAGLGVALPGFVSALGARFAIEGGRKKGRLKLYFYFHAAADVAFAQGNPFLTAVHAGVAGGLVAKAYGIGFELEVAAEFFWVRPQPSLLEARVKVTLDLPWPIPNLHYTLDFTDGADAPTQELEELVEGLTLIPRAPSTAMALDGGPDQQPVPVDPTFTLAFAYPTRNAAGVSGNFQITALGLAAVDNHVVHETSGGHGYAVELTGLRLWRGAAGTGTLHPGPIPAKWIKQDTPAAGGQPSRRVLELFSLEDVASARLVGPSAQLIGELTDGWTPCAPPDRPTPVCYHWNDEPPGPIPVRSLVELPPAHPLEVRLLPEPEGAESSRRWFGWTAHLAEVAPLAVLSGIVRALRLPAVEGPTLPDVPAAPPLELRFAPASRVLLELALLGKRGRVTVRFYRGDTLVKEDASGTVAPGLEGAWQHLLYPCDGPVDRAVLETSLLGDPDRDDDAAAYLVRVCIVPRSAWERWQDAVDSAVAWADFWTAATPDPLVLQPASHYTLEVEGSWSRVKDGSETPGGSFTRTFEFDTVGPDQWPRKLRGADQSLDGKSGYDLKTVPPAGAVAVYAGRPLRLEFRHRRVEALYSAFGRRLAVRLVDDAGAVLTRWLDYTPEPPTDLPGYELPWHDLVVSASCTPGDVGLHWHFPVVRLTDVLAPARRYDASVFALEAGVADFDAVEWQSQVPLYQFTFRTSRWPSFAAHAAASLAPGALDELLAAPVAFTGLAALIGAGARVVDDALLASAMADALGLPPRDPAAAPEVVRVWQPAAGGHQLAALLLDGPEPLPRVSGGALELRTPADVAVPCVLVQSASGTRTLVLFRDGGGLTAIPPAPLRLILSDDWIAVDGSAQRDTVTLELEVPPRPPILEPEGPP